MTEESGTTTQTTTQPVPVPLVDAEGKFREGWRDALDEDIRGEKTLGDFDNVKNLAKSYVHVRKMVGADVMKIPNEKSTDAEWSEFYRIGGRPDTAADFNFVKPDDMPEEVWNKKLALDAMDLFHKIGLSKKQAKAILDFNNTNVMTGLKANNEVILASRQEAKVALYKEWGAAYESKIHLGNVAIDRGCGGDEDFRARLTKKFGDDPDFIRYSSNLGGKFAEHGDVASTRVPTPSDLETQISEIMHRPEYTNSDPKIRKPLIDKVMRLREELNKSKGIT